jgi:hypothetical protein
VVALGRDLSTGYIFPIYRPAAQVGEDFYRVLPGENGEVLVVLGDVSGKGPRAAMTVSAVVGSLHMIPNSTPVEILRELNRSLAGDLRGGFLTGLAARIYADGAVALANAGHLPPYRNGEEIPLPHSLPLGITLDAEYEESRLQLAPGDTFTFFSHGVVEAQSPNGELFGFERTARSAGNRRKRSPMSRKPLARKTTSPCSPFSSLLYSPSMRTFIRRKRQSGLDGSASSLSSRIFGQTGRVNSQIRRAPCLKDFATLSCAAT